MIEIKGSIGERGWIDELLNRVSTRNIGATCDVVDDHCELIRHVEIFASRENDE